MACAVIASGPSTARASAEGQALRGRIRLLAVKENVRLFPWADVCYGCDGAWWHHFQNSKAARQFGGVKLAHDSGVCAHFREVHKVEVRDHDTMLFDEPGIVGSGGNSGFQAINIAAQFGANRILLIGFDMHGTAGAHWYGANNWRNANNPGDRNYAHWRAALARQAPILAGMGIDVVNASDASALACFRQQTIEQTLEEWNL